MVLKMPGNGAAGYELRGLVNARFLTVRPIPGLHSVPAIINDKLPDPVSDIWELMSIEYQSSKT